MECRKYGKATFADAVNNKYPIDTPGRIKAAWAYIHQPRNAEKYTKKEAQTIKARVRRAAEAFAHQDLPFERLVEEIQPNLQIVLDFVRENSVRIPKAAAEGEPASSGDYQLASVRGLAIDVDIDVLVSSALFNQLGVFAHPFQIEHWSRYFFSSKVRRL